jgi:uncharacterized protein (DUF433 family)
VSRILPTIDGVVAFGEMRVDGRPLSPWALLQQIRGGLSDTGLLEELGLLQTRSSSARPPAGAGRRT